MSSRHVKLNINGVNYKVTGIDKAKSYKDILCTIAKQNERFDSNESLIKHKTQQKQRNVDERKTTSPKSERKAEFGVKESSEIEKLKHMKIIYVEKNAESEKGLKKRKSKKGQTDKNETTRRAKDDSDIEVYHKSRRRMKNIMKRKCSDEADQNIYDKHVMNGISLRKAKRNIQRNHIQHSFMDGCDKISFYYLDEDPCKQKERVRGTSKSNSVSSIGGLRSKASSSCNSIKKRPSLKSLSIETKCGDDKDSGIPSWESEEISSKDDNKIEEKIPEETFESAHLIGRYNEMLNDSKMWPSLPKEKSKDCVMKKINLEQKGKFDMPIIGDSVRYIDDMGDQKSEREIVPTKSDLLGDSCFAEADKRDENWPINIEKKTEDEELESDFEIIKTEHTESSEPKNKRHLCKDDESHLVEERSNELIYDLNSNLIGSVKSTHGNEAKFNLENRGSFILIDFDDIQVKCTSEYLKTEAKQEEKLEEVCNSTKGASQVNIKPPLLQKKKECLNSSISLDKESCHGKKDKKLTEDGNEDRKEYLIQQEKDIRNHNNEESDNKNECQMKVQDGTQEETTEKNVKCLNISTQDDKLAIDGNKPKPICLTSAAMQNEGLIEAGRKTSSHDNFDCKVDGGCEMTLDLSDQSNEYCNDESLDGKKQINSKESMNENIGKEKEQSGNGCTVDCDAEQGSLTDLSNKMNKRNGDVECTDDVSKSFYEKARNFSQKGDKLITKFISKFAKQIEHDLKAKFCRHKKDRLFEGNDKKAVDSGIMLESNYKGDELWKKYVEVCEQIYNLSQSILFIDLKMEQRKFELEQIIEGESLHKDEALEEDENNIVKEIIEFRDYLKKVTLASRKNRTELKEYQIQIDKIDLALASKRSLLRSFEQAIIQQRCQNIPRRLLRCYNRKHGR